MPEGQGGKEGSMYGVGNSRDEVCNDALDKRWCRIRLSLQPNERSHLWQKVPDGRYVRVGKITLTGEHCLLAASIYSLIVNAHHAQTLNVRLQLTR